MNNYEKIFQLAPVSIWEEDWSETKKILDSIRDKVPNEEIEEFLNDNQQVVFLLVDSIKVVRVNDKTVEIYEADNIEQFRTSIAKTFCAESFAAFKKEICALYRGQKEFEIEALTKTFKGKDLYVIINVKLPEETEEYNNIILTMIDITPWKASHKLYIETKAKFHRSFYQGVIGMDIADINGNIIDVNDSFCDFLGYTKDELTCMNVLQLESEEDRFNTVEAMSRIIKNEADSIKIESRFIKKNGELVWGMAGYSLVRDADNTPLYFVSQIIDIDKEKKNYISLNKNLLKYKSLLESTNTLYIITNSDGEINESSPMFHTFLQCEHRCVENKPFRAFVSSDSMAVYDDVWKRLKQGQNINCAELLLVKNNVSKWVSMNASTMSNGRESVFMILTDITERKIREFEKIIEKEKNRDKLKNNIKGLRDKIKKIGHCNGT